MENGLLRNVALGVFYIALIAAPLLGGVPSGAAYQQDTFLNVLRLLSIFACLLLLLPEQAGALAPLRLARAASLLTTLFPPPTIADPKQGSRQGRLIPALMLAGVALTVASCLVHSAFLSSPVLLFALVPGTLDWIVYGAIFMTALHLAPTHRLGIATALGTGATLAALVSLMEALNAANLPGHRAQGVFFSPNFAAGLFALVLPLVVALCLQTNSKTVALVSGAAAGVLFGALVASGSRAGIALAVVGLLITLVLAALGGRAKTLPWKRVGALIGILLLFGLFQRGAITSRVATGPQEQSGDFRKWTWRGTVNMTKANPVLGTGPGTYPYRYPPYAVVEKTDLAHSSYLQTAAEQGAPALLALVAALGFILLSALVTLWRGRTQINDNPLLLCGLTGGLIAALGRNVFDSEWSILGNGIPFWCVAGLLAGPAATKAASPGTSQPDRRTPISPARIVGALTLALALISTFLCLRAAQNRDAVQEAVRLSRQTGIAPPTGISLGWPPDPEIAANTGHKDVAAQLEPSGRRLYQLARQQFEGGDQPDGLDTMAKAIQADPNNLQSRYRYAGMLAQAGKSAESLQAYRELIKVYESPAGQIRAIPELTETYPAFAYFAIGQELDKAGDVPAALAEYAQAAKIIEAYSMTSPTYQQLEIASALRSGINLTDRRAELAQLYQHITDARIKRQPADAAALKSQSTSTKNLLLTLPTELTGAHDTHGDAKP